MDHEYQWMVSRGRLGMRVEDSVVVLDVDPDAFECCRLNAEDSRGIIEVLTKIGAELWQSNPRAQTDNQNQFRTDENDVYIWDTSAGELRLGLDAAKDTIELSTDSKKQCDLDIRKLVEFIQILQHLTGNLTENAW